MNKDLHDIDDLFRYELNEYEETPSAGVKKSLETALDKKYNKSKRKFTAFKKTALLLFLFFAGFSLYELIILKNSSGRPAGGKAKEQTNYSSLGKYKDILKNNTGAKNTINDPLNSYGKEPEKNKFHNRNIVATNNNSNSLIVSKEKQIAISSPNQINIETDFRFPLEAQKANGTHLVKEANLIETVPGFVNSIKELQIIKDSLFKNYIAKSTNGEKVKSFRPLWMLTAFTAYERAGYRLDSDIPNNITSIKHNEIHEPSFSLGVLATRQLKKQWGLQTGLVYSFINVGISPKKLFALQDNGGNISFKYITSSGYAFIKPGLGIPPSIGDSLITTEGKHNLQFVSVPLIVKYSVTKNKLTITPGVGVEANYLTKAKVEIEVESPSNPEIIFINKLDGAKPFYMSAVADAEVRYKLNNKLSVSLRPAIRFAITPITENNVVETFPRSVGIGAGFTWKF